MITEEVRKARSRNIEMSGCIEVTCPTCKGKGERVDRNTRIAGIAMNRHMSEKHDAATCSCPRSTVAEKRPCSRCGGFGTVARSKDKVA